MVYKVVRLHRWMKVVPKIVYFTQYIGFSDKMGPKVSATKNFFMNKSDKMITKNRNLKNFKIKASEEMFKLCLL